MNLLQAMVYPYRNIPKILSTVLILGIALLAFLALSERGEEMGGSWPRWSWPGQTMYEFGLAGFVLTVPCFVIWLLGYSLDVIRHVSQGHSSLPTTRLFQNLGCGLVFLMSRLIWVGIGIFIIGLVQGQAPLQLRNLLVRDLAILAFALVFAFDTVVAAFRCALEERLSPAFELRRNLAFIFDNKKAFLKLIARLTLLNAAYVVAINGCAVALSWIVSSLRFTDSKTFIAIFCAGVFAVLIQYMSSLHLISQFAVQVVSHERATQDRGRFDAY